MNSNELFKKLDYTNKLKISKLLEENNTQNINKFYNELCLFNDINEQANIMIKIIKNYKDNFNPIVI